jgi:hypothetical protein
MYFGHQLLLFFPHTLGGIYYTIFGHRMAKMVKHGRLPLCQRHHHGSP